MTTLQVSRISPQTLAAIQVRTSNAYDIAQLFATLLPYGYSTNSQTGGHYSGYWRLTIQRNGYPDQFAYPGEYILVTDASVTNDGVWTVSPTSEVTVFGTSAGQPDVADFIAAYTADVPLEWDTSAAPVATATPGLGASIVVPEPTSANGPFTWALARTNQTDNTTAQVTVTPTTADGKITFADSGLTAGDAYTWTVTCSTQYQGVTATSEPSDAVTAAD